MVHALRGLSSRTLSLSSDLSLRTGRSADLVSAAEAFGCGYDDRAGHSVLRDLLVDRSGSIVRRKDVSRELPPISGGDEFSAGVLATESLSTGRIGAPSSGDECRAVLKLS